MMYSLEKSDAAIVAVKPANKGWQRPAEQMEPRAAAKVNSGGRNTCRTQRRVSVSQAADWIRKAAQRNPEGCALHRVPLAQREYLVVRVVGKTPRPAETTTRHCQSGSEGRSFGADPDRRFLGLCYGVQTRSLASCLRHQPRQEPRALTRMRGSVRGDWRKPVPYRDGARHAESPKNRIVLNH